MTSPTQRTLLQLRKDGWLAEVLEKWIQATMQRKDYLGIIDIQAIKIGRPFLGINATSTSNISSHWHKALAEPKLWIWLSTGSRYEIWGWAKQGPRGAKKKWTLTIRAVTLADIPPATVAAAHALLEELRNPKKKGKHDTAQHLPGIATQAPQLADSLEREVPGP